MTHQNADKKLIKRLKRAEGQVAAVRRMLDENAACADILVQLSAAQGALNKAAQVLLSTHIEQCVQATFDTGDANERESKVNELMSMFDRYGRLGGR